MKAVRAGAASLLLLASAAHFPPLSAQVAPRPLSEKWVNEAKEQLGNRAANREEYFAERRKSIDPDANTALIRMQAVMARQDWERLRGATPSIPAWAAFGPAPINGGQTPTSTPRFPSDVSGRTVAIAIDAVNSHVYIGAAQGGVWRSSNDGASWTPLSDNLASTAVGALAVVPPATAGSPATIYLGTGESSASCDSYAGVGLYKSTDGGATWTGPINAADFANRAIASIAVDRSNPNRIVLTTSSGIFGVSCTSGLTLPDRGIFLSVDGGLTWTKQTAGNRRFAVVLQDPITATTWWAGGRTSGASVDPANEGGLVRSLDNGLTWTQVAGTGGLPALSTSWGRTWVTATADPNFPGQSVLYIGNSLVTGSAQGAVYKSTNSGANWTEVTAARGYCSPQCSYDNPIWVEPGEEQVFYTGGAGTSNAGVVPSFFMRSNNGGTSFSDKVRSGDSTNALHADVHFITTWPGQPNRLWVANDGGVWRSNDRGDNWINVNSNLQTTQFSGCDLHPTDAGRMYAGSQDNGTQGREASNNWKHLDFGDGGFAQIDQSNPNNLVHTYFNQRNNLIGVGFTTNGFATTMGLYAGSFASANGISISDRVQFYAPIHLDRGNRRTLYFGTNRLWKAPNFFANGGLGSEFSALNSAQDLTGGTVGSSTGGALTAIETFANPTPNTDAALIYTGASTGVVYRSVNGGANWTQVDVGGSAIYVSDILIDPRNSNIVYQSRAGFAAAAGLNVRKSTDGGTSWAPAATGLPNIPVNALAFDPANPDRLWAGTDIGAFYTEDAGASWIAYNVGLPSTAIFDLDSNSQTRVLAACTHGRGAFVLQFPNPTTTTITGDTPDPSTVGQAVTVNYTVTSTGGTPTGNVVVTVSGGSETCTGTVAAGTCSITLTSAGARTLTATYAGNASFDGSNDTETHTVNPATTTTTISSDTPDPSAVGQAVSVNYTVTSAGGTPTGNVVVTVSGGSETCTGTVAAGTCSLTLTSAGARTLTATYAGDSNFSGSSDTETHTVNTATTTTAITADTPDPSTVGQAVAVNFTVTSTGGTPTGNVVVTASGGAETCTGTVAAGTCSLTLTSAGARTLTATYAGDANFNGSSDTEAHTVNAAATTTTITADTPDPSTVGQAVVVNYTVTSTGGTPTGNVVVTVSGGSETCTGTVAAGTCSITLTTAGARTLTATYAGNANFGGSSDAETHQVNPANTAITITSDNPEPSVVGEPVNVMFSLAVIAPGAGVPGGNIQVTVSGGPESCIASALAGVCPIVLNSSGTRTLTATYLGDGNFNPSSDTESHSVNPAPTTTTITSDEPDPSALGQAVNVLYSVASGAGVPVGDVIVTVSGGSETCTGTVAAGTCAITLNAVGTRTLTATYVGSSLHASSFGTREHVVLQFADLAVTKTNHRNNAPLGAELEYLIVASNLGPNTVSAATLNDNPPATLGNVGWTCTPTPPATCPVAAGTGAINQTIDLGVGHVLTYRMTATVVGPLFGEVFNVAQVAVPAGVIDPVSENNSVSDVDLIVPQVMLQDGFE